tara:strand:- start:273 stop:1073 length:801 start_codon:yes stop_codon:yes gene_type:complete
MKSKAIAFFCIFLLIGCGMSQKEKNDVAIVTCNIISETKEINGDDVLREVDKAREKIGEDKYLGNSFDVKVYVNFGLCVDFILNKEGLEGELAQRIESDRLAKEEAQRVLRENRIAQEEKEKIEWEKGEFNSIEIYNLTKRQPIVDEPDLYLLDQRHIFVLDVDKFRIVIRDTFSEILSEDQVYEILKNTEDRYPPPKGYEDLETIRVNHLWIMDRKHKRYMEEVSDRFNEVTELGYGSEMWDRGLSGLYPKSLCSTPKDEFYLKC